MTYYTGTLSASLGDQIQVEIEAVNSQGTSTKSDPNANASTLLVQTVPAKITDLADGSLTSGD
jgi:hypothetical protein